MARVPVCADARNLPGPVERPHTDDRTAPPSLEGIELSQEDDGVQRIRDFDLGRLLEYPRPRKVRELIARLQGEGKLTGIRMRPAVGRIQMRPGVTRAAQAHEYWLTEEQALFVAAKSETPRATLLLHGVIQVFVKARRGEVLSAPSSALSALATPQSDPGMLPALPGVSEADGDAWMLLASAERDLINASKEPGMGSMLARSALASVRGARALLNRPPRRAA